MSAAIRRRIPCEPVDVYRDETRAVGRFRPNGPTGFRAVQDGAPLRSTRAEAVADRCRHRNAGHCPQHP